jgi:type IX secretion system PorP/SprF family membrane protein
MRDSIRTISLLKWVLGLIMIGSTQISNAQQQVTYTHYSFNTLLVNPAYAGSRDILTLNSVNRFRWLSFPGAPKVQTVTLHSTLKTRSLGGGLSFYHDSKGPTRTTGIDLDVSYRMPLGEGRLAFGLKAGLGFRSNFLQSEVVTVMDNDQAFQNDEVSQVLPNVGIGIYYSNERFYAGFSSPKLLRNKFGADEMFISGEVRHFYFITGGVLNLNAEKTLMLKPSLLYKMTESTLYQFDLTALLYFNDKIWVGPMYRTSNDLGIIMGMGINSQLAISYGFDWSMNNQTGVHNSGSHELMLRYDFVYDKKLGVVSPRHF